MPQLSTTFIFMIYTWTWFTLYLIMQKTKTMMINKTPTTTPHLKSKKSPLILPWM